MTYARPARLGAGIVLLGLAATGAHAVGGAGQPELPEGWRWESYRDLEVAVPASWGHTGSYAQLDGCVGDPRPAVGRPAWAGSCGPWGGGDREVLDFGHGILVVQAPRALRERILATVRRIDFDANG